MATHVTHVPSTLDAFKYNLMYMTDNLFGLAKYLGLDVASNVSSYKFLGDAYYVDGTNWQDALGKVYFPLNGATTAFEGELNFLYLNLAMMPFVVDAKTAEAGNEAYNLFGLPFLPWDALYLQNSTGDWVGMHAWADETELFLYNPLRKEVLMRKLRSIATLGAAGALLWYGGKYVMQKYKRFQ